jgi:probable rRNA maturation factor
MSATNPPLVEVMIEAPGWESIGLGPLAERAARAALEGAGVGAAGFEIALLAASDARIAELNAGFRGRAGPTNVLSFPAADRAPTREGAIPTPPTPGRPEDPAPLGDIALAYETCVREAEAGGLPLGNHVAHLIVHGTLHLLGYDHDRDGDATLMEALESRILAELGVPDPYHEAAAE